MTTLQTIHRLVRAAVLLAVMLLTSVTAWADTYKPYCEIEYCKGGIGYVFIKGWSVDKIQYYQSWELPFLIRIFRDPACESMLISAEPRPVYRADINSRYGITGKHGLDLAMRVEDIPDLDMQPGTERTIYIKIYAINSSRDEFLMEGSPFAVTVKKPVLGDGSAGDPFLLEKAADWELFADEIADPQVGAFYADKCYKLSAQRDDNFYDYDYFDYDSSTAVTKMFGTTSCPFTGTFDGNGQTLNVNINSNEQGAAPFHRIDGATIKGLKVVGSVCSSANHAAGLVGVCGSTAENTITACDVSTRVTTTAGYAGGIVGHGGHGTLSIKDCVCNGTVGGFSSFAGGLVGWCDALTLNLRNCLFKGGFTPATGGKYQPIACKYATKTVTAPAAREVYYLNTVPPSDGLGDNRIIGAEGKPLSETLVDNEWDDPIRAVDGNDYYGVHFSGISLPYEYGFPVHYLTDGWSIVEKHNEYTGLHTYDRLNWYVVLNSYQTAESQYLVSPEFNGRSGIMVQFDYAYIAISDNATLQMGYSTTTSDIAAFYFDEGTTINNDLNRWFQYERVFPVGTKYIAVKLPPSEDCWLELDNFRFTACDTPSPTHLTAVHITDNMASLTWEAPETDKAIRGYAYQYKKTSDENWSDAVTVTTTAATIDGLSAETDYQFRVKALYGENEESIYVPVYFTTTMELPYEYGFENDMNGWKRIDQGWGYTKISDVAAREGKYGYFFHSLPYSPQYLISPQLPDNSPLVVSFYYKDDNPASGMWETFYVGYSTTTNDPDAFTWGEALYATNIPWRLYENTFPEGTRFVAIKYTSSYTAGLYIDDISVAGYSVTPKPVSLIVSNVSETGATIRWTAPNEDVKWYVYQYRKSTDDDWSAETIVKPTTVTLDGLTENTTYNFRVKAESNYGPASNYATASFLTEGSVVDLPYYDSFENGIGNWRLSSGDQATGIGVNKKRTGDHCFYFHKEDEVGEFLYSPHFAGIMPMKVSFYFSCAGASYPSSFRVGYATSRSSVIFITDIITVNSSDWTRYEAYFPAKAQYIIIFNLGKGYPVYLDDFSFTAASEITLLDNADNTSAIASLRGEEVAATLQDRTIYRDGDWNTLCLPFSVSNFEGTHLERATVKTLTGSSFNNGTLTLNFSDDLTSIEAGKPYIVKWADATYLNILSEEDWNAFAQSVNSGKSYAGKTVMLGANISVSTMVGTAEHPFDGIFDGNSNCLTFNYNSYGGKGTAPFRYIKNATIKCLTTKGEIQGGNYSAGLVGYALGSSNTINNCLVNINVDVIQNGQYVGGILGNGTTSATTISDCAYNGYLYGIYFGTIYGWSESSGTPTIKNCLSNGYCESPSNNAVADLILAANGATCSVTNCYKLQDVGTMGTYFNLDDEDASALVQKLGDQWTLSGNEQLTLKMADDTTTAYWPAVNPIFYGVTISDDDARVTTQYVDFQGTYAPLSFSSADPSILFLGEDNTLYYPVSGAHIGAQRAYFRLKGLTADSSNGVRSFVLNFGDSGEPLSISPEGERTDAFTQKGLDGVWYTIDGRKLSGKPATKGLYIYNGHKIAIK